MKKSLLSYLLGAGSMLLLASLFNMTGCASESSGALTCSACNDGARYTGTQTTGGGEEITQATLQSWNNNFQTEYGFPQSGFYFSKKAIDKIFKNECESNGIVVYLARDDAGNNNAIITGAKTLKANITTAIAPTNIFVSRCYCPPCCGPIIGPDTSVTIGRSKILELPSGSSAAREITLDTSKLYNPK